MRQQTAHISKYSFEDYFMKNTHSADTVYVYTVENLNQAYQENASADINENKNGIFRI